MKTETMIARNLRMRMEAEPIGQKALAVRAGLNETYVRDILVGKSLNPRQEHLTKLARALHCNVADLTAESPAPPPSDVSVARDILANLDPADRAEWLRLGSRLSRR